MRTMVGVYTCRGVIRYRTGSFSHFLALSIKNPWNFLSNRRCVCYANKVTQGGPLEASGWG